ncbi:MAG TPA: dihydroorotase [Polyangiaceae bacterium]
MNGPLVFRNVRAVDPASNLDAVVDVVVERGKIVRVGPNAGADASKSEHATIVERAGAMLMPGFVDLHAHVREPGQEYKEDIATGLKAAAAGGFTDICAMPNTKPVNDTRAITEMIVHRARAIGGSRLHPIGAITVGQKGEALTEMADLREAGAVGVSDDGRCVTSSAVMRRALEYAATFDLPVIQHAEDHALTEGAQMHEGSISTRLGLRGWPRVAEDVIVARDVLLAEYTHSKYHLAHASTMGSVRILREAKSRNIAVTAEVTPHHLLLTHEALLGYDTACKVNPPLREAEDVEALRQALADGTIDCIATDHAPHSSLEKECELAEAAPGLTGLELMFPLLFALVEKGVLPLARFVDALTRAPAKIVGLPIPKIADGHRADLVLVDPNETWTVTPQALRSKGKNTPFMNREVKGRVRMTIVAGHAVFDANEEAR